jgi:uncharacterized protein YeeX (DUF496 family)
LWLRIAKVLFDNSITSTKQLGHAISTGQNKRITDKPITVQEALAIIRDNSANVLKVEDLLNLFPPEAKVEEMKKHLCSCLEDYETNIKQLRN